MRVPNEMQGSIGPSSALHRGQYWSNGDSGASALRQFMVDQHSKDEASISSACSGRSSRLRAKEVRGERELRLSGDSQVVTIALRCTKANLVTAGDGVFPVSIIAGTYYLCRPRIDVRLEVEAPYDFLQLELPSIESETAVRHAERSGSGCYHRWTKDALIDQIGKFLASDDTSSDDQRRQWLASELIALRVRCVQKGIVGPLQTWRLKHVKNYIETRLGKPIPLKDMAREARLSPMHFAAQFKATTGLKPHDYVLFRRIERAKALIETSNSPLVQIALETGFQGQSHFTAIFKRFVGETPGAWRRNTPTSSEKMRSA